ncbi:tetratricopeptide repeat protein [uncultured Azonexus sp.]|uniref:tetratricopeptide repeat protein n=1 Tax=uncultured Azonexus sp. TaxID=520307 RepID=UPI002629A8F9|nr:tetratricopeptide repeat protein [uncultured Azonexus sp.]
MNDTLSQAREHFLHGIAEFEAGRDISARNAFLAALELAPGRLSVMVNLAATHFRLGEFAAARELLQAIVGQEPENLEALVQLGICEEALGHWDAAARALEKGLATGQPPDLWLLCSQCFGRSGNHAGALTAVDKCLAAAPGHAEAWSTRGSLLREIGRYEEAAEAFRKAIAHGGDNELNRYYLASVSTAAQPTTPPASYVQALFDDYADDFQQHLLGSLRYQGHRTLTEPLLRAGKRYPVAVDLGCGTGLCGEQLLPLVDHIDGVDLSGAMLEQARARNIYRRLEQSELNAFLAARQEAADLFIAADVFSYVGDLDGSFAAIRRLLKPGGCFAFTVEQLAAADGFALQPCLRYHHSETYIRRLAEKHGFRVQDLSIHPLRYDQERPIPALYVYLA